MTTFQRNKVSPDNIKLYRSIGSLIKDYRQWRELSQEALAESIRVSVRELQNWEAGRCRASIENLNDFSEISGIPMQVCIALNSDQPLWYSLRRRRFAYSLIEMQQLRFVDILKCREQPDVEILANIDRISTDKQINMILSCHRDIFGTQRSLKKDVIKKAIKILPQLNNIVFDSWGHYLGHRVCLPIKKDVYKLIKEDPDYEAYLTTESISDIIAMKEGVFFYYSSHSANISSAYLMITEGMRYFSKIEPKEKYLVSTHVATKEVKEVFASLGMREFRLTRKDEHKYNEFDPTLYEIELDVRMKKFGSLESLGLMLKKNGGKVWIDDLPKEAKLKRLPAIPVQKSNYLNKSGNSEYSVKINFNTDSLIIGNDSLNVDGDSLSVGKLWEEFCPNNKCTMYRKTAIGNIVSNGTYRTKDGSPSRRFLCKKCGKSFCSRAGSIFYGLRSSEDKVLTAIRLLAKGMSIRGVAKVLKVRLNTVRNWLKVATEHSEKIDTLLKNDPKVSMIELNDLWEFVRKNSLHQRAIQLRERPNRSGP